MTTPAERYRTVAGGRNRDQRAIGRRLGETRHSYMRLLEFGPFERRPRGGWRFGTKVVHDRVVARLVASGRARIEGDRVVRITAAVVET